ncbi:MAG TPA: hypothetical protein VH518_18535 [Tepidisphaeraceae bacterium]|jgi:hypothetical protein
MEAPAPVLGYEAPGLQEKDRRDPPRWLGLVFLLGCSPLLVAPFVSFTWDTSPLAATTEIISSSEVRVTEEMFLGLLGVPFFLGIVIVLWQLRLIIRPRTAIAERVIAYTLAGITATIPLLFASFIVWQVIAEDDTWDVRMLLLLIPPLLLVAGAMLLWLVRRSKPARHVTSSICLDVAYLSNATFCVAIFASDRDIGWWLTAIGSCGLIAELVYIFVRAFQRRRLMVAAPAAAV